MASHSKIHNISSNRYIKKSQAFGRIEQCISDWVEYGVSIRDLTLAEAIQARSQQAKDREPLPLAEIHGLKYEPASRNAVSTRESLKLAYEDGKFAAMGV